MLVAVRDNRKLLYFQQNSERLAIRLELTVLVLQGIT